MQDLYRYECYVYIAHADVGHLEIHVTGRKTRLRSELLTGMLLESQGSAGRQLLHKFKIYVFCCCRCRCCRCRCRCCAVVVVVVVVDVVVVVAAAVVLVVGLCLKVFISF